jgi:hypothetical protein
VSWQADNGSKDAKRGHLGLVLSANSREFYRIKQKSDSSAPRAEIRGLDQSFLKPENRKDHDVA